MSQQGVGELKAEEEPLKVGARLEQVEAGVCPEGVDGSVAFGDGLQEGPCRPIGLGPAHVRTGKGDDSVPWLADFGLVECPEPGTTGYYFSPIVLLLFAMFCDGSRVLAKGANLT
jgi:hypothetical protein